MRGHLVLAVALASVPLGAGCGGCGDDDGGDGDAFELVSRTPEADADNVHVFDPIVLTFSHPLDPATVTDASISLAAGGEPIAHDSAISEDGTTVTLLVTGPPATPAEVTVTVSSELLDEDGTAFAGAGWSYQLPVWQHSPAGPIRDGSQPRLVNGPGGAPVLGWVETGGSVFTRMLGSDGLTDLGLVAQGADLMMAGDGESAVAAFVGDGGILVMRWNGQEWGSLGTLPLAGVDAAPQLDVAIDGDGNPVIATYTGSAVQVARWNGSELADEPPLEAVAAVGELALAVDGSRAVVALVTGAGVLRTFRQADGGWEELAGGIDPNAAERPDVAAADGVIAVSWQKQDASQLASRHAYAARWSGTSWLRTAHAADLDIQTHAAATSIALDGEQVIMAWFEGDSESRKVYAARATSEDDNWTFLDSALNGDPAADASLPSLAIDGSGNPMAAFVEDGEVMVARWNGSPTLRPGLAERLPAGDCAIPEDAPPATLAATGCYADVAGHRLAPQLIPFEISSPLWSDGALKRRFLLIPDGQTVGWTDAGALTMPVGTLLVKEFWLEQSFGEPASRFPIETRFLVKRCEEGQCVEPWQGYSYRWNQDGTEAALIDPGSADERTDWTVTDASGTEVTHTHIYPARLNCTRCHNAPSGRVLGLQAIQLDRPVRYGEIVAGQLETLTAIGVLAGAGGAEVARLPSSLDPSYDYQARSRAYYHVNCAQCHLPGGERPTIDFRFQAPLAAGNICDRLTPGDGTGSTLYVRDATRGAGQMPPLATDVPDSYQLATTAAWIDGMTTCP
jgi:hypothetical protein